MNRLEILMQYLKEDPSDPFNLYAVALEMEKSNPAGALVCYEQLLIEHSEYTPTYYHAGHLYWKLGKLKEAEATFQLGIKITGNKQEYKAQNELKSALMNLQEEEN